MPKIDPASAPVRNGTGYPPPYDAACCGRERVQLGLAAGLTQFGVNRLLLPPGQWSSQRHWHDGEDEFVYVLAGELVLVTDGGETVLRPGDCAGFKAGEPDGHHLQNRSDADAIVLEVGTRLPHSTDGATYPDIDLHIAPGAGGYSHKDGTPY